MKKRPGLWRQLRQGFSPLLVLTWLVVLAVVFGLAIFSWQTFL
ncbi:hypothetical protein [Allofournierella sp.]|nr:hypothetical protein [Fournierella sp.]MEE0756211.1 hypothetical protein [Fournierella sp.]